VADNNDATEVEFNAFGNEIGQMIDSSGNIVECLGPTSARLAEAPVLQVPYGEVPGGEISGHWVEFVTTIRHPPEPTVKKAYNRWTIRVGKIEVANLAVRRSVLDCVYLVRVADALLAHGVSREK
jgi:hypothetical protein